VHAQRQFFEVKSQHLVIELPETFLNRRVEIIALVVDEEVAQPPASPPTSGYCG